MWKGGALQTPFWYLAVHRREAEQTPFLPRPLTVRPRQRPCLAHASARAAQHGIAHLSLGLDIRLRRGEGSASGWATWEGGGALQRSFFARKRSPTDRCCATASRIVLSRYRKPATAGAMTGSCCPSWRTANGRGCSAMVRRRNSVRQR